MGRSASMPFLSVHRCVPCSVMSDVTLTEDGHAKLDVDKQAAGGNVVALSTAERSRKAKAAHTGHSLAEDAELVQRRLDTVDLVVMGATIRQVADRHDVDYYTARDDYMRGMEMLNERTARSVAAMRDEVTMRQKAIIMAMLPEAKKGDTKAAGVVQRADDILAGLWGLRSARLEIEDVTMRQSGNDSLQAALDEYLEQVIDVD